MRGLFSREASMFRRLFVLIAMTAAAGCATVTVDLPAITDAPSGAHDEGRVIWRDLLTATPAESRAFYGELFGWTFEKPGIDVGFGDDDSYMLIRHNGRLIGGMINANRLKSPENVSQWVTVLSVADVNAATERARSAGAEILTEPRTLLSRGTIAVMRDPEGALFALLQARGGDPAEYEPLIDGFLWDELWTADVDRAARFYESVVGYSPDDRDIGDTGRSYRVMQRDGSPRVGILENPFEGERPVWINYLRVADPAAVTARVEALGGRVLVDAQARDIGGIVAVIVDPSGAGIALQTWPNEEVSE